MKVLGREPAVWLYGLQAVLSVLVAFGVFGLTETSAAWVLTIGNGVMALIVAIVTRPFVVSALTGAIQTLLTAAIAFGLPMTEEQMGVAVGGLSVLLGLVLRPNVSPEETAVTHA